MHNQSNVALVYSQAAIILSIKCTVTSITVLNWTRSLNQLGKQNHVKIAWIPGHAGVHGKEVAGRAWYGMENGMERKFQYGIWKMPEWNGMEVK